MSFIITPSNIFYSSFVENRSLSSNNFLKNFLYGRVIPIVPKLQICNFKNKTIDIK
jgi:hypothetical protein